MDTKRIYRESRGSNYTGYNRASSRRKRSVHVKKLFVGIFSLLMILGLSAFYGSGLVSAHDNVTIKVFRFIQEILFGILQRNI